MAKYKQKTNGFSLLELFIAMALGIFMMVGLMSLYLNIHKNYQLQKTWIDLQTSGRFAIDMLSQSIRTAGFVGCRYPDNPVNLEQAIIGYSSTQIPAEWHIDAVENTDMISVLNCDADEEIAYFIGDTQRKNSDGINILALYRKTFSGKREELIPGVENIQILYGVCADSNRDTLIYYKAAQVPNWSQLCSVDIDLLINSIDSILLKPEDYLFQGELITATDRLLHKNWETYFALRET